MQNLKLCKCFMGSICHGNCVRFEEMLLYFIKFNNDVEMAILTWSDSIYIHHDNIYGET